MSEFTSGTCADSTIDPSKRVNYVTGLVLGADEFCQEQAYLLNRDQVHQWALHGYGVVLGLDVSAAPDNGTTKVTVQAGRAVDPFGRPICVPSTQCADLEAWVASHADEILGSVGSPPGPATIYVTLCYKECETDQVPLPTGPCASTSEAMAASRIADSFSLSLTLERPLQVEENATRLLGDILRSIRVEDGTDPGITRAELFDTILAIPAEVWIGSAECGSPPEDSIPPGSPPSSLPDELMMSSMEATGLTRDLIDLWVREVRPHLFCKRSCAEPLPDDPCLLLAEISFDITDTGQITDPSAISVVQGDRPSLLTTRMLQEWLAGGIEAILFDDAGDAGGDLQGTYPNPTVVGLQGNEISPAAPTAPGQVLTWNGAEWEPGSAAPTGPAGGDLDGTYPNPTVDGLRGNPIGPTAPTTPGQVLTWNGAQWEPDMGSSAPTGPAGGDLDGTYPNPTVDGLRGNPIGPTAPTTPGQVLTWNGAQWEPDMGSSAPTGPAGGDLDGTYPNPTVDGLRGNPISPVAPTTPGQVLTWNGAQWQPGSGTTMPTGPAGGDLDGTYPNPTVDGLQNRPVLDVQPEDKQVLTWDRRAGGWRPGDCFITAAGRYFLALGQVIDSNSYYGDLILTPLDDGFLLRGPWYEPARYTYVVKFTFYSRDRGDLPIMLQSLNEDLPDGIFFRPSQFEGEPPRGEFFVMVEITAFVR